MSDFVDLVLLIAKDFPHGYDVYNVGSGRSYSLEYVSMLFFRLLHKDLAIKYRNESRVSIIYDIVADTSKTNRHFHWKPNTNIEQGLGLIVESNK
ncbi:MAG: hypothetical protein WA941_14535 [Nitrososphaeraceae archaeon]